MILIEVLKARKTFFEHTKLTINLQKPDTKFTKQGYLFLMEKSKLSKYLLKNSLIEES